MRVALTVLWHNRAWAVAEVMARLDAAAAHMARLGAQLVAFHVDDASVDATPALLRDYLASVPGVWAARELVLRQEDEPRLNTSSRDMARRARKAVYAHLAVLRNAALEWALGQRADYQWSVDSDVLVAPDCLERLVGADKPYVAALIANDKGPPTDDVDNRWTNAGWVRPRAGLAGEMFGGTCCVPLTRTVTPFTRGDRCHAVDYSGACYVVDSRVLMSGARYAWDYHGEDIAYCRAVREAGYRVWVHAGRLAAHIIAPEHLMAGGRLLDEWGRDAR